MFNKILIANRGEIALRIIRTCRELGVQTVAVYSEADRHSLHVRFADEAVCIGPAAGKLSYLNIPQIISAAHLTGAEAIHPGYGFLAENAEFSDICTASGFTFIGPTPDMIEAMGDKARAKETMKAAGVPVVPGSDGVIRDIKEAKEVAAEIGFPVMIKAVAGGGGRGMRMVTKIEDFDSNFQMATSEAANAFNNGDVYIEKFVEKPRHVEIQVFGDNHGNVVHYNERECSIQRRHQKLLEESPSPVVTEKIRQKMGDASIKGCMNVGYVGAGTIEYLLDAHGDFYFMEMNTRIQVEHCVTEQVTGLDLIEQQLIVADGGKISRKLRKPNGHAIECRINAEDVEHDFRPSPGHITSFHAPGGFGVRLDSHVYAGYSIPPYYDSLVGKLICWGADREDAIDRMRSALDEFVIEGIKTTIPFHKALMRNEQFRSGEFDTKFLEDVRLVDRHELSELELSLSDTTMNFPEKLTYTKEHEWISVDGNVATIGITDFAQGELGDVIFIDILGGQAIAAGNSVGSVEAVKTVSDIYSPVSGTIIEVNTKLNDAPETVNKDPYGEGWLLKVEMSNPEEIKQTLSVADYRALIGQ